MECISTTQYSISLNVGLYGKIQGRRGLRLGDPISPLLFIICMEYFIRILNRVAMIIGFEFHTKCKGLKLNHLCFVDDMLLFCKGTYQSVVLMLRGLQTFTDTSGLSTNARKSKIFSANMKTQSLEDICELTGYQKGTLPFRYLGVPISAKKLTALDYEMLLEKLAVRVCRPKKAGGLWVLDCMIWNEASVAKYAWNIAQKADNLWVRWVDHIYLSHTNWWDYTPPTDYSWYWKKICSIRDKFKAGYMGNGWITHNGSYTIHSGYQHRKGEQEAWYWEKWCHFSKECLKLILQRLGLGVQNLNLHSLWKMMTRNITGRKCRAFLHAVLTALVYNISKARNRALWKQAVPEPRRVRDQIKEDCKIKVYNHIDSNINRSGGNWIGGLYNITHV
ncbi:uncharacterized protein LOC132038107 [Lycium ferocissimum]|uniref:uncharacterized protein LOC132038107 n=1 Tax=Lycium ferocissimum TaxID=112874 RepID=UPI00281509C2|nr:uncharacterized protein LOC132038107 [Lycium ferocissimum]